MVTLSQENIEKIIRETELSCIGFKTSDSVKNKIFLEVVRKNLELTKKMNEKLQFYQRNIHLLHEKVKELESAKRFTVFQRPIEDFESDEERPRNPSPVLD